MPPRDTERIPYRAVVGGGGRFAGATGTYWHTSINGDEQAAFDIWVPSLPPIY